MAASDGSAEASELGRIRRRFEIFAEVEARGSSPTYEALALAVSRDEPALTMLAALPTGRRQPNLLFGVLRWHGVPVEDPPVALAWLHEHGATALAGMRIRRTQTNEVARCAVLLPALATISPTPLALIEVGASAGLCLLFDAWHYRYKQPDPGRDHHVGDPHVGPMLTCTVEGRIPLPERVPEIGWRIGLDLNPLDASLPDVQRWLECLVWPEHRRRAQNLRVALSVARDSEVRVETGNLITDLPEILQRVPPGLTPVVIHSATLAYLEQSERQAFVAQVSALGARRLGLEGLQVLPDAIQEVPAGVEATGRFGVTLDGRLLALADGHGNRLAWL